MPFSTVAVVLTLVIMALLAYVAIVFGSACFGCAINWPKAAAAAAEKLRDGAVPEEQEQGPPSAASDCAEEALAARGAMARAGLPINSPA